MAEKKQYKYQNVGSVIVDNNDSKKSYIQFSRDMVIKEGDTISLKNEQNSLDSIQFLKENNKISEEVANSMIERVKKVPWYEKSKEHILDEKGRRVYFVRFQLEANTEKVSVKPFQKK